MYWMCFSRWRRKWLYITVLKSLDTKLKIFGVYGQTLVSYDE